MENLDSNKTRRTFIKASGAAAAGVAALSPRIAGAFAGGDDEIKVGLVGCGGKGTSDIRQVLGVGGNVKLWAMGDAIEGNVQGRYKTLMSDKNKDKVDCKDRLFSGLDAYKKVIDSGVDVVFLVTSPGFRPVHFDYAINQGKHVFMQKPCAVDGRGCRMLLETNKKAKEKGLKVGVGFQRRHDAKYIETIKRLQDGAIGDIESLRAYWDGRTPWTRPRKEGQTEMEYQIQNWYYFNWLCGDHIAEQHIHNLDVCNWLMGDYPGLAQGKGGCEVRNGPDSGETFDHHQIEYVYGEKWDGPSVRMYSSCRHIPGTFTSVSEHARGSKGYAIISSGRAYDNDGKEIFRAEGSGSSEMRHKTEFIDAIRNNKGFNEGDNGAMSTMTAVFGRMATYSGKLLKGSDCLNTKVDVFPYDAGDMDWNTAPPVLPDDKLRYKRPIPGVTKVV
jgi:myo-inositol 2-dehydrogenase/D-chiro-inositol 1-dehydrogenase